MWIVYANQKIAENRPQPGYEDDQLGGTDYVPPTPGNSSDVHSYELLRASAYASAGLFALSAIYGWVIEARCQALKKERKERRNAPQPVEASARRAFPSDVLGFGFEFQPAQAGVRCTGLGGTWSFDANVGFCRLSRGPAPKPDVRIDFELGVPSQIALIYPAPTEQLGANYAALTQSMIQVYGPPQATAPALSSACAASLSGCLQAGEHPTGSVWRWPRGSIELSPALTDDGAELELHYLRGDPEER
jgi:hypothetical protein